MIPKKTPESLVEGALLLSHDDELSEDEVRAVEAEAEASGLDFAQWGAEIRAKAEARLAEERARAKAAARPKARAPAAMQASAFGGAGYDPSRGRGSG
jgi:hypothetical protein